MSVEKGIDIALRDCLAVRPDDRLLILTDPLKLELGKLFWHRGLNYTSDCILTVMNPTGRHSSPLPNFVARLMKEATCVIAPTTYSISHTDARREATEAGVRIASLPGITADIIARAMNVDYRRMARVSEMLADLLSEAKEAVVITGNDTAELHLPLEGRRGFADTGLLHRPGSFSNLPAGEAFTAPVEGKSEGTLVVNGSFPIIGLLGNEPITIKVERGLAVEITGGRKADKLRELLSGEAERNVAELGIGTNPKAKLTGIVLEDEKILGTIHVAFGDNKSFGGTVGAKIHLDGVLLRPTLILDDRVVMDKGKLLVD